MKKHVKLDPKKIEFLSAHPKPVTRREFIARGLMEGAGFLVLPSAIDLVLGSSPAMASPCGGGILAKDDPNRISVLVIDANGGIGFTSEVIPRGKAGSLDTAPPFLSNYSITGLGNGDTGIRPVRLFSGNSAFIQENSVAYNMLLGLQRDDLTGTVRDPNVPDTALLPAEAFQRTVMGCTVGPLNDDTESNEINPLAALFPVLRQAPAGIMGTSSRQSGGNSRFTPGPLAAAAVRVNRPADLQNALSLSGRLTNLTPEKKGAIARTLARMSSSALERFSDMRVIDQYRAILDCGLQKNIENLESPVAVDPRTDPVFQQAFNINAGSDQNSDAVRLATLVYNLLKGNGRAAVFEIGDCDVHNNTQILNDTGNQRIWTAVRQSLLAAHLMGLNLFIYLISDGSASTTPGGVRTSASQLWPNENGNMSQSVMIYYDKDGKGRVRAAGQVGHFLSSSNNQGAAASLDNPAAKPLQHGLVNTFQVYCLLNAQSTFFSQVPESSSVNQALVQLFYREG